MDKDLELLESPLSRGDYTNAVKFSFWNFKLTPVFTGVLAGVDRAIGIADAKRFAIVRMDGKTAGHMLVTRGQPLFQPIPGLAGIVAAQDLRFSSAGLR